MIWPKDKRYFLLKFNTVPSPALLMKEHFIKMFLKMFLKFP